jgi:hypothetical protein
VSRVDDEDGSLGQLLAGFPRAGDAVAATAD